MIVPVHMRHGSNVVDSTRSSIGPSGNTARAFISACAKDVDASSPGSVRGSSIRLRPTATISPVVDRLIAAPTPAEPPAHDVHASAIATRHASSSDS